MIAEHFRWGAVHLESGRQISGPTMLCWHLMQRHGETYQHQLIRVASELKYFQRLAGENIRDALQRHDMLLHQAFVHNVTHNNTLVHSLELLGIFKISRAILPLLLFHTGGIMPRTVEEYNAMRNMMVNWAQLIDNSGPNATPLRYLTTPKNKHLLTEFISWTNKMKAIPQT